MNNVVEMLTNELHIPPAERNEEQNSHIKSLFSTLINDRIFKSKVVNRVYPQILNVCHHFTLQHYPKAEYIYTIGILLIRQ